MNENPMNFGNNGPDDDDDGAKFVAIAACVFVINVFVVLMTAIAFVNLG